jgi:hypothetical protein
VEGLLTELEKIKIMILPDGEKITTEITKKQREILDALHICVPKLWGGQDLSGGLGLFSARLVPEPERHPWSEARPGGQNAAANELLVNHRSPCHPSGVIVATAAGHRFSIS